MDKRDKWMHLHARPLDLVRWEYLRGSCNAEQVLKALSWYQNEDGGFGHGLEADNWNPDSSAIQTWKATTILRELGYFTKEISLISQLSKYLMSTLEGGFWKTLLPSNDSYPHAVWWNYDQAEETWGYNPTAALLGYLYRLDEPLEHEIRLALDYFFTQSKFNMHELPLFIDLYLDLRHTNWDNQELLEMKRKLERDLKQILVIDPEKWSQYVLRPSSVFTSANREFKTPFEKDIETEKKYILESADADGTWKVPWDWGQYPEEFTVAREWWKTELIIRYERFLQLI